MKQLQLTGLDSNNQLARLSFVGREVEPNGLGIDLVLLMTGLQFTLSTFCFGFNLASFSSELELMESGERQTASFFNFDESLVLSLSQTTDDPPVRYAFLSYRVPNPHPPASAHQVPLDASVATFASAGGTHVSIAFLRIHERSGEVAKLIDELVSEAGIAITNPYSSDE